MDFMMKNASINTEKRVKLFENPILEALTVSTPVESTFSSLGISAVCIWLGFLITPAATVNQAATWAGIGLASWSLFEYLLHRFLFHLPDRAFRGAHRFTYVLHGVHHDFPDDARRTLMPFAPKLVFSVVFFGMFFLIFGQNGPFFSAGFLFGYYIYSMIHYAIHQYKAPKILKFLWAHHHVHHHLENNRAFGVTSRLWDRIFNTMPSRTKEKRPTTVGK